MAKRILWGVVIVVVGFFFYLGYKNYDAGRTLASGDVLSSDKNSKSNANPSTASQPIVYPAPTQPGDSVAAPDPVTQTAQIVQPGSTAPPSGIPATDSIDPNPPNGVRFSGSGRYQLYRQGNLTYRLDTNTGQSCILFATDEEWKKPRVLRDACGKR